MQLQQEISKIYMMKKNNKFLKISITSFIILLLCTLLGFLIIFPAYSRISVTLTEFDPYRISKATFMSLLTQVSPTRDENTEVMLGQTSMEESLTNTVIDKTLLEDSHTQLQISSVNILGRLSEGADSKAMLRGFWHFPTSAMPGELGNVVIIGHRFQYLPPAKNTFFYLDKVKVGDEINLISDNGDYTYIVISTKIVAPNDISVLQTTKDYRLTLITCTPLWTSNERLVITAKLDKLYKKV